MRIEICGGIASGKTSLANYLGKAGYSVANEKLGSSSLIEEFYSNPELFTFETEISFLIQHSVQIKKLRNSRRIACDYSFEQDYAYALNNLNAVELNAFVNVYDEIKKQLSEPDLIIRLECSTETLKKRIQLRGREYEQMIDNRFLDSTNALISQRLSNVNVPVILLDSEKYDFREANNFKTVLKLIDDYLESD